MVKCKTKMLHTIIFYHFYHMLKVGRFYVCIIRKTFAEIFLHLIAA